MEELMKQKLADAEPPKLLPVGNYVFELVSSDLGANRDATWEWRDIRAKVVEPCDDVDPDALEEYGSVVGRGCSLRFLWPTDDESDNDRVAAQNRMIRFSEHLGLADDKKTLEQIFSEAKGSTFIGQVEHRERTDDPEAPPNVNIVRTAPVE